MTKVILRVTTVVVLLALAPSWQAAAQLANKDAPIIAGHYHLNASNIDAHMKFWVDTLGGKPMKFGPQATDVVEFPGIFIFLRKQAPTGPTRGTTFDHIGFAVPNVAEVARARSRTASSGRSAASRVQARRRRRRRPAPTACSSTCSAPTA